jgi:ribosomal protein L24E
VKPETKFYAQVKKYFKEFSLIRLENLSVPGTPDLLVYNNNRHFFTIELKVTKTNKVTFSPHQIAFHVKHPLNTFILVLDACLKVPKLYEGKDIRELVACGLKLDPRKQGWTNCVEFLKVLDA